jgi:hypothetical protein
MLCFDSVDRGFQFLDGETPVKFDIDGQQDLLRAQLQGPQITDGSNRGVGTDNFSDAPDARSIGSLPHQQSSTLARQNYGDVG